MQKSNLMVRVIGALCLCPCFQPAIKTRLHGAFPEPASQQSKLSARSLQTRSQAAMAELKPEGNCALSPQRCEIQKLEQSRCTPASLDTPNYPAAVQRPYSSGDMSAFGMDTLALRVRRLLASDMPLLAMSADSGFQSMSPGMRAALLGTADGGCSTPRKLASRVARR